MLIKLVVDEESLYISKYEMAFLIYKRCYVKMVPMILLSWVRFIHWYDIGDIMTGAACGAGNAYPSRVPGFTSGFHRGSCCSVICVSLFYVIVLSFVFWVLIVPFVWLLGIYIFYLFRRGLKTLKVGFQLIINFHKGLPTPGFF